MNKLIIINRLAVIFIFFQCAFLCARPIPEEIKGTYNIFNTKYQQLSPLLGMVWATGPILENYAELGWEEQYSLFVLQSLYRRIDQVSFLPSTAAEKLSAHLTPYVIGKIVYHLERVRWGEDSDVADIRVPKQKEAMVKFLSALIVDEPSFKESRKQLKAEYDRRVPELENLLNEKERLEREAKNPSSSAPAEPLVIQQRLKDIEQRINRIRALSEGSHFSKRMNRVLGAMIDSVAESNANISVFKILTALVYDKSPNKEGFHEYLMGIIDAAKAMKETHTKAEDIFKDVNQLVAGKDAWIAQKFLPSDQAATLDLFDYEISAFRILNSTASRSWLQQYLTDFAKAKISSGILFYDCGETSLLTFYKILFGNETTKKIDVDLLKEVGVPHPKVLPFFGSKMKTSSGADLDFATLGDLRSLEARNAWADVTANLNCKTDPLGTGLVYCISAGQEQCEMEAGYNNALGFIKKLFGVLGFEDLVEQYNKKSSTKIEITKDINPDGQTGVIKIQKGDMIFYWHIDPGHYYFSSATISTSITEETLKLLLEQSQPMLDLASLINNSSSLPKYDIVLEKHKDSHNDYFLYFNRLNKDDTIYQFFRKLVKGYQSLLNRPSLIEGLLKRIQHNDTQGRIAQVIITEAFGEVPISSKEVYVHSLKALNLVDNKFANKRTLIFYVRSLSNKKKAKETLDLLLKNMSQPAIDAVDNEGNTALQDLFGRIDDDVILSLIEKMSATALENVNNRDLTILKSIAEGWGNHGKVAEKIIDKMSVGALKAYDVSGQSLVEKLWNKDFGYDEALMKLIEKTDPLSLNKPVDGQMTFLERALDAQGGRRTTMALFLISKMNQQALDETKDSFGYPTLLFKALGKKTYDKQVASALIEKMSPSALDKVIPLYNESALHLAIDREDAEIADKLINKMSREALERQSSFSGTALEYASVKGQRAIADAIRKRLNS